jgi:hypothetical protein
MGEGAGALEQGPTVLGVSSCPGLERALWAPSMQQVPRSSMTQSSPLCQMASGRIHLSLELQTLLCFSLFFSIFGGTGV